MRPPSAAATSAIILAGGRGARMGGYDKARLTWRGQSLIQRLCAQLKPQVSQIIVVRSQARQAISLPSGVEHTRDAKAYAGPVGGLLAGLKRSRKAWCLCLPIDGVVVPQHLSRQLARRSRHGGYVENHGNHYYLHQLIARQRRHELQAFHAAGGRSAGNACRELRQQPVTIDVAGAIWSINTPGERRKAQRQRRSTRNTPLSTV
ncbi:MAG: molybdenum cofactor guanylyltransferase [Oceanococcus sp.]